MAHYYQICLEASSSESAKKYALGLEERCNRAQARLAELEAKLAEKEKELEEKSREAESAISSRNKVASEFEKQKVAIAAKCVETETLLTRVAAHEDFNRELKESEWDAKAWVEELKKQVEYYESAEYTDKVVVAFQGSEEFKNSIILGSSDYMKRGLAHMVRQLHHFFEDKTPLINAYKLFLSSREARGGANFVPFSEEKLKDIHEMDAGNNEDPWIPPTPSVPTFFDMVDSTMLADIVGIPTVDAPGNKSEVGASTSTTELPPPTPNFFDFASFFSK